MYWKRALLILLTVALAGCLPTGDNLLSTTTQSAQTAASIPTVAATPAATDTPPATETAAASPILSATVAPTETPPAPPTAAPTLTPRVQTGAVILYASDNDLWRADTAGKNRQRLTTEAILADWFTRNAAGDYWWSGGFPPQVHVSPNGRWLAFTQTGRNLVLVDVTGAEPPRFRELDGWASIFTWAPDSQRLAYSIEPHFLLKKSQSGIFIYDVADDSKRRLTDQHGNNLVWSPDGRFLAFSCCYRETGPGPYEGTRSGDVRQIDLATQIVSMVGETWIGVASGPPPNCWSADGTVGIDVAEPVVCSYERPFPVAVSPDGNQLAALSLRGPDDDDLFRLLTLKDRSSDTTIWQQQIPQVQTVFWTPDGQWLLLSNHHVHHAEAHIWRIPADGSEEATLLVPDALLLGVIPQ